jgi:hypothetical protein
MPIHVRVNEKAAAFGEAESMASVLESRHGAWAADVADFFATFHDLKGDTERSRAWAGVAKAARRRADDRQRDA